MHKSKIPAIAGKHKLEDTRRDSSLEPSESMALWIPAFGFLASRTARL